MIGGSIEQVSALMDSGCYQARYGDLADLFQRTPAPDSRFVIHYGDGSALDVLHAMHIPPQEGLEWRRYEGIGHGLARRLRDSDLLHPVIERAVSF
jgi:hypothetical protein